LRISETNPSRPYQDRDCKYQDQDQDCIKVVSSALETETEDYIPRTTTVLPANNTISASTNKHSIGGSTVHICITNA